MHFQLLDGDPEWFHQAPAVSAAHDAGSLRLANYASYVAEVLRRQPLEGGTNYGTAMRLIRAHQTCYPSA